MEVEHIWKRTQRGGLMWHEGDGGILSVVGIQRRGRLEGPEMRLQPNLGE